MAGLALVGGLAGWLGGTGPSGARLSHAGGTVRSGGKGGCSAERQGVVCTVQRLLDN
ncbi:MAG TPA: hypothetical protein VK428_10390 [Acidimicrobiales bacterium]|nr:hypothetical protein [Acidimicrobiales bacterium]